MATKMSVLGIEGTNQDYNYPREFEPSVLNTSYMYFCDMGVKSLNFLQRMSRLISDFLLPTDVTVFKSQFLLVYYTQRVSWGQFIIFHDAFPVQRLIC